jgi:hypothetical protein
MTYKFATETLMERAQQSRKMAAQAPDPRVAAIHQTIADTYDKLAASRAAPMNIATQAAHSIKADIACEQRPKPVPALPPGCMADVERCPNVRSSTFVVIDDKASRAQGSSAR